MTITRREALKWGFVGGGTLLLPWGKADPVFAQFSPQIRRFERPFQIPPLLSPIRSDAKTDYYEITVAKASIEIIPGLQTQIWGYNGLTPGPTIRQQGGRRDAGGKDSVVRFINKLGQDDRGQDIPLSTHLHGMASLPHYDGYAEDLIPVDYFKDYIYPNDRAATLWYHDHSLDRTSYNVYRGLAGMYIVEDEYERNLPLPQGEYDLPLILQDKQLAVDGQLIFNDNNQRNLYGDIILVNGVPWPRLEVANRKYRFRILNASASRNYNLILSRQLESQTKGDRLIVIGTDAGLMASPVVLQSPTQTLPVVMAERYDVLIDFSEYPLGTQIYLRNLGFTGSIDSSIRSQTIMRFEVTKQTTDDSQIPNFLREVKPIPIPANVTRRVFRFERNSNRWKINNKIWDRNRVDANPRPGDVEIWDLVNPGSGWVHPVHIHLLDFQILSRNGQPPRPHERGWKDVFSVGEFETVRVVGKFGRREEDGSNPFMGKFMMHCHNLVHEDHAMMTQFEIGQGGPDPVTTAPAKPITQMLPL
jgi:spore coat protein A